MKHILQWETVSHWRIANDYLFSMKRFVKRYLENEYLRIKMPEKPYPPVGNSFPLEDRGHE